MCVLSSVTQVGQVGEGVFETDHLLRTTVLVMPFSLHNIYL